MPQHRFAKDKAEGHFVYQSFQCACPSIGAGKIGMGPGPEVAMAVAAVVALHAGSQWVALKGPAIQCDSPGKYRVGVGGARKADPTFITQRDPKGRAPAQIPRDRVGIDLQLAATKAFTDFIFSASEAERILPFAT